MKSLTSCLALAVLVSLCAPATAAPPVPAAPISLFEHIASRCLTDQLARTEYAQGWEGWFLEDRFLTEGAPRPAPRRPAPMEPVVGPVLPKAERLRAEWTADPKSHTIDCSFTFTKRDCPTCPGRGATQANYAAYLPRDLFLDPAKVTSVLLLVPGGNGGRTRYFLTPVPDKSIHAKKSGGLEVKKYVDTWVKAHPGATPPIVVALDSAGFLSANGHVEYMTHDLPDHIARVFLGRDVKTLTVGADGISSGSRAIMAALRDKPGSLRTVGLHCMHCRRFNGIDPQKHFGKPAQRRKWLDGLTTLRHEGQLDIKWSVGNRDNQWPCNKEFYDLFVEAGFYRADPPKYGPCDEGAQPSTGACTVRWDGFDLYNGQGHHYGLMRDSWAPHINWHLDRLANFHGGRTPDQKK